MFGSPFCVIHTETDDTQYKIAGLCCIGDDSSKKITFHEDSFVKNYDIRALLSSNRRQFLIEPLFDLNFTEDGLTMDVNLLKVLLNKAR